MSFSNSLGFEEPPQLIPLVPQVQGGVLIPLDVLLCKPRAPQCAVYPPGTTALAPYVRQMSRWTRCVLVSQTFPPEGQR